MARKLPSHLKLHVEQSESVSKPQMAFDLNNLLSAFTEATGWVPRPVSPTRSGCSMRMLGRPQAGADAAPEQSSMPLDQRVKLVSDSPIDGALDMCTEEYGNLVSEASAWKLLGEIDALITRLDDVDSTLRNQEAQLATSVGVSITPGESEVLSERMQESLQRAVQHTCSDAAAIYLLDEGTSQLKMRSCWGMPASCLTKPARDLRGSLGDLEALMGNAVLLENTSLAADWQCPEDYKAAMCLPIGSPTMPQGTLWLFSTAVRDFASNDIESAKAATDKILVDIERSLLAGEVLENRGVQRDLENAAMTQSSRLPAISSPLHTDYDVAGWTYQGQALGGNFHDWTVNRNEKICLALGSAQADGAAGALVSTSVQTVVETCWNAQHSPQQILRRANDVLWQSQDGDWRSSLAYVQLDPDSGEFELAMSGDIQAFIIGCNGYRMLSGTLTPLAEQPDTKFTNERHTLESGELLMIVSAGVVGGSLAGGLTQDELLRHALELNDDPAGTVADSLARMLPVLTGQPAADRSLLVLKRRF